MYGETHLSWAMKVQNFNATTELWIGQIIYFTSYLQNFIISPSSKLFISVSWIFCLQSWIPKQAQYLFGGPCKFKGHLKMPSEARLKIFFSLKSHQIKTNKDSSKINSV